MIEKIKQETLNVLSDLFLEGLEMDTVRPKEEMTSVNKKLCLHLIRQEGKAIADFSEELQEEYRITYQEIEQLQDREFEILRAEILSLEVADLPS
ncbi:hypothetical protein [Streptococcus cuniculi]|uniref:Uncharacterized protein n=1 Tax=Streptococcus cuniculi TaxID=1432788 RepID=A0A4Y9JBK0_9STRE|nr:hypothetical protein [Streptococcus cuniculi]MBF0778911.1 hypothetical protein [Streptococcus cuniculi]TFU97185.1 hypothetical protein E4T82_09300 [Streptococcus cuniculi]